MLYLHVDNKSGYYTVLYNMRLFKIYPQPVFVVAFFILFAFLIPQNARAERLSSELLTYYSTPWVDSVFSSLTLDQRIAQLLMIRVPTNRDTDTDNRIIREVMEYNIGGVAFFRGTPHEQVMLTNRMQSQVQTPLLVAMDAEWGPSMRLDSTIVFPRQMALGAIQDDQLIYLMGVEIGRQLQRLGVHINFAPVVDVNNNPANPVINFRAFGESRYNVTRKGLAYMHGLQDAGIIACAKHFPGHGDTDADSHHTLPLLRHSFAEIDSIHLYPFRHLIEQGVHSIMIAHLEMPSLEPEARLASTLSRNIVTNLLQIEMGFDGLIITDALDMRGVSDFFEPGELELRALMAGNDILLLPEDVPAAISAIRTAIEEGLISEELVNAKCKKVLYYKKKAGLDDFQFTPIENLIADLNTTNGKLLNKKLAEAAITLVRNEKNLIPLTDLHHKNIAALAIGDHPDNRFQKMLGRYAPISNYGIDKYHSPEGAEQMLNALSGYDAVIVSIHDNSLFFSRNYGINGKTVDLVKRLAKQQDVVLSLFANPYSLEFFGDEILDIQSILVAFQEGYVFEEAAAQAIFGGIQTIGKLPVTAGSHFRSETGIITPEPTRIRFGKAEETGIRSELLQRIDSIAISGIRMGAYPGCQIAIIKDGVMIYNRSFGYHTYDSIQEVRETDLYDLASVTKIAATTAAVMKLYDQGIIDIDNTLGAYMLWLRYTDKGDIVLRHLLAHQARLTPWIPFYMSTIENGSLAEGLYKTSRSDNFHTRVAEGLYLNNSFRDSIFVQIFESELLEKQQYRYSDLGFILLAELIEELSGQRIDAYLEHTLFKPLGLSNTGFLPLKRFEASRIVPSELDTIWRKQIVRGHVHDMAAAMLGGVSGHAGMFSNAVEVAILMQLFLNEGSYGGVQFFDKNTIREFTRVQYYENDNRRGLGFDKPSLDRNEPGPASKSASPLSFGHSGFTGTVAWADPMENLVYVFLSNRTFPDMNNRKLIEENIRTNIQQVIYDAIYHSRILEHFTTVLP